jgi:ribose-phosphate pyrophosphokinase
MSLLCVDLSEGSRLAGNLIKALNAERAVVELRQFPDGEHYLRLDSDCSDREAVIICRMSPPDTAILPLMLAADTLRDLGARRVGLIAPYLPYMRQDKRFKRGESVSSRPFARFVSRTVDWLATVDPHFFNDTATTEIYTIPNLVCQAAPLMVNWIRAEVQRPVLIGPDSESEQWVRAVAEQIPSPWQVLEKTRSGDRDVSISMPRIEQYTKHTPVLVDDIISTGRTMIETVGHLLSAGLPAPVCVGTHALFAGQAYNELRNSGASRIVSCNTIDHPSNAIDVAPVIVQGIRDRGLISRPINHA